MISLRTVRNYAIVGILTIQTVSCARVDALATYYKHGTRIQMGKMSLFYKAPVTKEEVTKLGNYLNKQVFNYEADYIALKLLKSDEIYELYIITKKGVENDDTNIQRLKLLGDELSRNVFQYSKTDIHMTDDDFQTVRVVPCLSCYNWIERRKRVKQQKTAESQR